MKKYVLIVTILFQSLAVLAQTGLDKIEFINFSKVNSLSRAGRVQREAGGPLFRAAVPALLQQHQGRGISVRWGERLTGAGRATAEWTRQRPRVHPARPRHRRGGAQR